MEEPNKPWWKDGRFIIKTICEVVLKSLSYLL